MPDSYGVKMRFVILLFAILIAGCGGSKFPLAAVSGTITYDGEPLEGAEVVFAPLEVADTVEVGPASVGITDAAGKYTLKTAKGLPGAVATQHRVSVGFGEIDEVEIARQVEEVHSKNLKMTGREVKALRKKIRRSMAVKKSLPKSYNINTKLRFNVTEPTDSADFELKSDGS